jgi:hypothetical protein
MTDVSDHVGQIVGNYQIQSLIGAGGMGTVYLGVHRSLPRKVAIKVLRREFGADPIVLRRFLEEARAASAVVHPNIVDVQDVGTLADGLPFTIMEFLPGDSLGRRLAQVGRLSVAQAVAIIVQAAAGLQAVHDKGIIHRDLKPDNLFLTPDQLMINHERVKVLDFGIAKLRGDLKGESINTRSGALLGTPLYMSPEQCRGLTDGVDHRTDIYALGVILYEMICGEPPFRAEGFGDLMMMHMSAAPPAPSAKAPEIPAHVERAILRCLAKSPDARFGSMKELRAALEPVAAKTMVLGDAGAVLAGGVRQTRMLDPLDPPREKANTNTTLSGAVGEQTLVVNRRRNQALGIASGAVIVAAIAGGLWWKGRPGPQASSEQTRQSINSPPAREAEPQAKAAVVADAAIAIDPAQTAIKAGESAQMRDLAGTAITAGEPNAPDAGSVRNSVQAAQPIKRVKKTGVSHAEKSVSTDNGSAAEKSSRELPAEKW